MDIKKNVPMLAPGKAYFDESEVAERLGMSVKWLRKMRDKGEGGPAHHKFGGSVRYYVDNLLKFEAAAVRRSTSDLGEQLET